MIGGFGTVSKFCIQSVGVSTDVLGPCQTDAAFMCFVLSMVLHPDAQRRAMAEVDEVVAMDRLPDFEDRSSLPYVEAVLREVWRWRPITPLGASLLVYLWWVG